jgi:hypothetical protein
LASCFRRGPVASRRAAAHGNAGRLTAQASRLVLSALSTEEFTKDDFAMRNGALQS